MLFEAVEIFPGGTNVPGRIHSIRTWCGFYKLHLLLASLRWLQKAKL